MFPESVTSRFIQRVVSQGAVEEPSHYVQDASVCPPRGTQRAWGPVGNRPGASRWAGSWGGTAVSSPAGQGGESASPASSWAEDVTSPGSGATSSVEKHFFEESLVKCQEEEEREAVLPSPPSGEVLPELKTKIMRMISNDCQQARAPGPWCLLPSALGGGVNSPLAARETEA